MITSVFIENDKLDLFEDENIEVVSSIADSSDVTKNTTDYSKSFTVPASDTNNRIFKHYYNADIDNSFDGRTKIDGRIELDGLPFKSGKFTLQKVNVKSGKASSYSINFFGKLVGFKDKVKADELPSLDLSTLNFDFTPINMITALGSGLSSGKIISNLISKKRLIYNTDPTDTTNTDTTINIANIGLNTNILRPSIQLIEIIKAIEEKYDIAFSRDFFNRAEFLNLYMWLNNSAEVVGGRTEQLINWTSGNGSDFGLSTATDTWVNSTFFNNSADKRSFKYRLTITTTNPEPYEIVVKNFGVEVARVKSEGGNFTSDFLDISSFENVDFSYQFFISTTTPMTYTASILLRRYEDFLTLDRQSLASSNSIVPVFDVSANLPKIKVIDFIKTLSLMFKLVFIQNSDTEIYINTLPEYYSEGRLFDVTKYIDFESIDVSRGKIFNEIDFKFDEPKTLLNEEFKQNTGLAYGDEELKLTDENGDLLDGEKLEVKPKVEQILYERLNNQETGELTSIMYGLSANRDLKPQNPSCLIFYNVKLNVIDNPFKVLINTSGDVGDFIGLLNTASFTDTFDNPQFATIFSEEFNPFNGALISNNLYTNYWKDYIESVFNIKRRNFNYSAILPLHLLLTIKLNDILKIKESYYRIDKYTANITNGKVELSLINSFDNTINPFTATETIVFSSAKSGIRSVYVRGTSEFTISLSDDSWITATIDDRNIILEIDQNDTGLDRISILTIESGSKTITIPIFQGFDIVRADNTIITADTTLITADNG
jgi:hypothetical protein